MAHTRKCELCQKNKRTKLKYGLLPEKEAEAILWKILCVDLVGPYHVTFSNDTEGTLSAMTFMDPASGWFEIHEIKT